MPHTRVRLTATDKSSQIQSKARVYLTATGFLLACVGAQPGQGSAEELIADRAAALRAACAHVFPLTPAQTEALADWADFRQRIPHHFGIEVPWHLIEFPAA